MHTSEAGQTLIKLFESCLKPTGDGNFRTYRCPAGVLTIGWGTTKVDAPDLKDGDVWSPQLCDEVFAGSLGKYEAAVTRNLGGRTLPQHKFDALVSAVYNCGADVMTGSVGKAVREERDADVPALLARWNKADGKVLAGLVRRRKAEGELWLGDFESASKTAQGHIPGSMAQSVDAATPARPASRSMIAPAVIVGGATAAVTGSKIPVPSIPKISMSDLVMPIGVIVIVAASILAIRRHSK